MHWILFKRIVLYFYRCVIKVHGTIEQNTPVWIGVTWLISVLVVVCGLILCFRVSRYSGGIFIGAVITVALELAYMGFLVIKRRGHDI